MATSGQTLNDRINAARYALAGQGLARCVCKATTEEIIGPKKKHLDYLLACTHEPNVSIPQLANLLIERTNHIYWVVVFKALVTVHHLMSYGNERFTQYLASSNYSFELSTFLDKTAARDFSMSTFIRRYSRYINEKALSYRLLAFDFCNVKRGNEGVLRVMPIDRLLKTLPILQNQLDALLEFDCSANDLNNGVINACFMLLFRDLIGLFACHNDGIINLLDKYFNLNRKMCREAFELYKKFLVRMDKVSEFLRVAEVVGIDKDEIPDLRRTPSSLIDALEQHLQNIESNKKILKNSQSGSTSTNDTAVTSNNNNNSLKLSTGDFSAFNRLTPPSSRRVSPGNQPVIGTMQQSSASQAQSDTFSIASFKDEEVRKALEEEARVLSQYNTTDGKLSGSKSEQDSSSPKFAVATGVKSIDDIFGDSDSFATTTNATRGSSSNGFDNNNSAFDNLSITSSSSSNAKNRLDPSLLKSSLKSAASTLETSSNSAPKKASDELFSLLDTSATATSDETQATGQKSASLVSKPTAGLIAPPPAPLPKQSQKDSVNPMNLFANPSPFDIQAASSNITLSTKSNGFPPALKPGNPFPDATNDFANGASLLTPVAPASISSGPAVNQTVGTPVFKSGTTTANYTNLGALEGFGDVLQPMSSSNKTSSLQGNQFGQAVNNKSSFTSGSSVTNTGLFKGDLDSTLANLAQNLTFDGINKTKK